MIKPDPIELLLSKAYKDIVIKRDERVLSSIEELEGEAPSTEDLKQHGSFIEIQGDPNTYFSWRGNTIIGFSPLKTETAFNEETQSHYLNLTMEEVSPRSFK